MKTEYNLTKLKDIILTFPDNIMVEFYVSLGKSSYVKYEGNQIQSLGTDIIDTLCIENIFPKLNLTEFGISPVLVIKASNNVQLLQTARPDFLSRLLENNGDDK